MLDPEETHIGRRRHCLMAQRLLEGQGLLIITRSHSDTPHSVGILSTSDQPDVETSTDHDMHAPGGIRILNPRK